MHHTSTAAIDTHQVQRLQCQRQWRGFLHALGQEFAAALSAQDLATLMARIGVRFAAQHPLNPSENVTELQQAMNAVWDALDWGQVELAQAPAGMEIQHRFSPLVAALGETEGSWATGFLQGVYQQWFDAAGAAGLRVQTISALDALGNAHLRLVTA
ncbi:cellulose synthase [Melaminivora suipulveris]|uniref:Cellulose synthase n=1 Tax=Melaminivora suipulveris TaxID=2109913 RepID=A0A2R3QCL8_9BURK|nr:cellulose biosynthesis protein BcsD [Melaminivora suipulveris]AVO49521.1 cellulose synthase [Melaminivora suipulveris]